MAEGLEVNLAQYKSLSMWKPTIGDFVFFNGLFSKWVGVINSISGPMVSIIIAGNPFLLCNYAQEEMVKNTIKLSQERISRSAAGKYGIMRNESGTLIWYI